MGTFDFLKRDGAGGKGKVSGAVRETMDAAIEQYRQTKDAVLLDVRTAQEYGEGHIPGSQNVALQEIETVSDLVTEKGTPLFVYCRSGARSGQAVTALKRMGYVDAVNIGGILDYHGELER